MTNGSTPGTPDWLLDNAIVRLVRAWGVPVMIAAMAAGWGYVGAVNDKADIAAAMGIANKSAIELQNLRIDLTTDKRYDSDDAERDKQILRGYIAELRATVVGLQNRVSRNEQSLERQR